MVAMEMGDINHRNVFGWHAQRIERRDEQTSANPNLKQNPGWVDGLSY